MITKGNLDEILNSLSVEEVEKEINKDGNYIELTVDISNGNFTANILSSDYNENTERIAQENGDLFCDKDDFIKLLTKSNSKHSNYGYN